MKVTSARFNRRSVMFTWLISYISVLLVPVIVSSLLYAATFNVVRSEINRANESLLQQTKQAIDSNLRGIERISLELALNKSVSDFQYVQQPLTDSDYYNLVSIANDLRQYKLANEYIEQIYIYYKNSDTVLSSTDHISSRDLYAYVREREDMSYEEWRAFFNKRYLQEYAPVEIREGDHTEKAVLYAKSVSLDNPDQPGAVILFVIKDMKLLENISTPDNSTVAVLDKQNRLVAAAGVPQPQQQPPFLAYDRLQGASGLFYDRAGGKQVAVSYTTSDNTGWKYVSTIPAELFDEKMSYMKKLIYASIALSLVLGGVVTFVFLRRNYVPISLLIRSFALKSGFSFAAGSNEYLYLQDALNNTFAEKEKIDKRLKQHHNAIRSHFLQGLLRGRPDQNVPVHEALAAHDIRVASPYYAVLLFHIENYGKFEAEGYVDPRNVKLLQFIVMNVAEEVATERHQAFTTELDDMPTCIVNFVAEPDEEELRRIAGHVKSFLLDHFHVNLTVAISGIHQDLYGIARAYQETIEAMQYRLVMGSGEMIGYADLPEAGAGAEQSSYYYPLHLEQQLINLVKTGDYERSNELIQTIVQMNTQGASLSVPLAKCLMFDLIGTMLKTLDELGPDNKRKVLEHVDPIERLTGCETIKDMQVQIRDVLERVCGSIREDRRNEANTIGQQVIAYVTEHYSDENLNISTIGEAFELTPSYLSKQFKTQTGEALLEFINKTRLEHAKRLLAEPGQTLSVSEIARKVGYADINTFNRIFKKYEGITPSKFKEMS